jgi:hypothetical protein
MGRRVARSLRSGVATAPADAGLPAPLARSGAALLERISARGVQIYECRADAAAPGGAAWSFVAPQATLFDARGAEIGTHDAGPHWRAADGSRLLGTV